LAGSPQIAAQQDPFRDHSRVPGVDELLTVFDFEPVAYAKLPREAYDYTAQGVESEFTLRRNREAFNWVSIVPKSVVDVSSIQTASEILGTKLAFPIMIAPSAGQGQLHPQGELAMHQGSTAASETPMVVSGDRARLSAALRALMQSALRERGEAGAIIADCSQMADGAGTRYVVIAIGDDAALPTLTASGADQAPPFDVWRHGGLGLALPVARQVIEGHGGKLWSANGAHSRAAAALRLPLRT